MAESLASLTSVVFPDPTGPVTMILGGMLILGLLSAGISLNSIGQTSNKEMADIRELLMNERQTQLVDLVANAYAVLETADYYESAQRAISDMRFGDGGSNHFFVFDTDGMFWVQPARPDIVGTVQIDMTDAEGKEWVSDVIEEARSAEHVEEPGSSLDPCV